MILNSYWFSRKSKLNRKLFISNDQRFSFFDDVFAASQFEYYRKIFLFFQQFENVFLATILSFFMIFEVPFAD